MQFTVTLFCRIDEVEWLGPNIVILKQITITPPYKPENVKGNVDSKAYTHIRKIVSFV